MITTTYKYRFYPNQAQKTLLKNISDSFWFFVDTFTRRAEAYHKKCSKYITVDILMSNMNDRRFPDRILNYEMGEENAIKAAAIHALNARKNKIDLDIYHKDNPISYMLFENMFDVHDDKFVLPKVGTIRVHTKERKYLNRRINYIHIKSNNLDQFYILVTCTIEQEEIPKIKRQLNKSIGLDFSLDHFYVTSTGEYGAFPFKRIRELILLKKKYKKSNKHKMEYSRAYQRNSNRIYKIFQKINNIKKYTYIKLANELTDKYDFICTEDLSLREIISTKEKDKSNEDYKFTNSVYKLGYRNFLTVVKHKCDLKGKKLLKVDRYYKSSQICNNCGYVNRITKDISVRTIICPNCKITYDRDVNAAKNIKDEAIRKYIQEIKNKKIRNNS